MKLNDNVKAYVRTIYEERVSKNQAAPEPIFLGPAAGTGALPDTVGVDVTNPYNPFGVTLDANTNEILIGRRPVEGGPRIFTQTVDTSTVATGLQGSFDGFNRTFYWDVNASTGLNRARQSVQGTYNVAHIQEALGPAADCVAPCVPLNIFGGPGTITPAMLDYILFTERDVSKQLLELVTANFSGPIVNLPAGEADFAVGYEYRRLSAGYSPDQVVIDGDSNGVPSLPSSGSYFVNEAYAEVNVPLLANLPAVKSLDLSLSTRHSEYSTFGGTTNSKYGIRWQPEHDLTVRANYGQGFRAPSVGELYSLPNRFDANINDPCSASSNPSSATLANCAQLGVPAGFEQANTQISIRTGGNSTLKPETSETTTAGLVYSPGWAARFIHAKQLDVDLNFYHIKLNKAIDAPDAQTQLDRCVATLEPVFCNGITRSSTGDINNFTDKLQNIGIEETQGYDIGLDWTGPTTPYGQGAVKWQTTYTEYYKIIASDTGLSEPKAVGVEVNDSGVPRWRSTLNLNWTIRQVTAGWTVRYLSSLREQCGDATGTEFCSDNDSGTNKLNAVLYDDLRFSWMLPLPLKYKLTLSGGVNNAFDTSPPICLSCSLNGYDASTYDLPGRFGYVEASMKF